jgi:hypothetical protein
MGRHGIRRGKSAGQTTVTAAAIAVAAAALAIWSAGTANAKTHHGPGAPGNPFGGTYFVTPQAGVVQSSTTSIVRHNTTTSTPTATSNSNEATLGLAGGPLSQRTSNGSRTGGTPGGGTTTENDRIGNTSLGGAPANGGPPAASSAASGGFLGQASKSGRKH